MKIFQLQIISDLHLETPKPRPSYSEFTIPPQCPHLALLGDIGNASDPAFLDFLFQQTQLFELVFYLLGNHEPYGTSFPVARATLRAFEAEIDQKRCSPAIKLGKFILLDQTRYDVSDELTVLGCTLFSSIKQEQEHPIATFVSDFSYINDWMTSAHNAAHQSDLQWLNTQIEELERQEPHRFIMILTHHSPTTSIQANDPRHLRDDRQVQSAFVTDLSKERCWTSRQVKLWAFGHTHFNCDFPDPVTGKRVFTNQKGCARAEAWGFDGEKVVTINTTADTMHEITQDTQKQHGGSTKPKRCTIS